ncbi:MAG: hypothetical protein Q7R39_09165 [Dehalococcoidia bacterium]|nr:hypothetical protein [Dehalococcoidia bacterium]
MPRIFDNIDQKLLPALQATLGVSTRADFCVGYFNLRGWKQRDSYVDKWAGSDGQCCRLLVGMQRLPQEELAAAMSVIRRDGQIDNQTAIRLKKKLAEEFRHQLAIGMPTNDDEAGLPLVDSKWLCVVVKHDKEDAFVVTAYLTDKPKQGEDLWPAK